MPRRRQFHLAPISSGQRSSPASPSCSTARGRRRSRPGTARRRALDAALAELDEGAEDPSIQWRRDFSLLLGLERLLADEPPKLRDGAELNPHQVDALSGTLTELMAEQQVAIGDERARKASCGERPVAEAEKARAGKKDDPTDADEDADDEDEDEEEERARRRG